MSSFCGVMAYHFGPWTGEIKYPTFTEYPYNLVHIMDMASADGVLINLLHKYEEVQK